LHGRVINTDVALGHHLIQVPQAKIVSEAHHTQIKITDRP
jgi:hypothetical protein